MKSTNEKSVKEYFGENIKKIRKVLGMTQKDLAAFLNTSRTYVCEVEHGNRNPTAYFVYRMEIGFHVPIEDLFKRNSYERFETLLRPLKAEGFPDKKLLLLYDKDKNLHRLGINPKVLVEKRELRNMKQIDLARMSGLSRSHISGLERGIYSPSMNTLIKISEALKCNICDFFAS